MQFNDITKKFLWNTMSNVVVSTNFVVVIT